MDPKLEKFQIAKGLSPAWSRCQQQKYISVVKLGTNTQNRAIILLKNTRQALDLPGGDEDGM